MSSQDEITLRSGSPELDSCIRGGFKTGNIYEVFGQAGTGKNRFRQLGTGLFWEVETWFRHVESGLGRQKQVRFFQGVYF